MPRHGRKDEPARLNLKMSQATRQQLEHLQVRTGADTLTEVIRRALAVYDLLIEEKDKGATPVLRSEDGKERELVLL